MTISKKKADTERMLNIVTPWRHTLPRRQLWQAQRVICDFLCGKEISIAGIKFPSREGNFLRAKVGEYDPLGLP